MHFKSVVIFYAVYFFTSVWSTGLNKEQIEKCILLYQYPINIPHSMKEDFGIKYPNIDFEWKFNQPRHFNIKNLVLALAYEGTKDNFENRMLTSFEVDYYVKKFTKRSEDLKQLGWILSKDIRDFFISINIEGEQYKQAMRLIPWTEIGPGFESAVEFLSVMIDILPEGNGLNENQIKEFMDLYTSHIAEATGSIDPLEVKKIFNGFGMFMPQNEQFDSYRPAAKELMELMIVTAERSTIVHENEIVLSTQEVRLLVAGFKRYDTDHDGLLYESQAKRFLEDSLTNNPQSSRTIDCGKILETFLSLFDFSSKKMNIAEFLFFYISNKTTVE
ncbi:uncharacterized protein LOC126833534 isoform X4 [Adelges cooleyi]|uniref:uncharacterized protein LOC126833534 isoform X3 n=1 Tax=Adelges cooleyi TaxID=133065 RepID=UPI00218077F6|nr:uncharacterized protein LOC126833534 isoform X3 [Adelges cooleyi]XP_050420926.1 uncharacterized protein LOC126833534 isoform X4 [Adelges cooleyi]